MLKNVTNEYLPSATGIPAGFRFAVILRGFRCDEHVASDGGTRVRALKRRVCARAGADQARERNRNHSPLRELNLLYTMIAKQQNTAGGLQKDEMSSVQIFKYVRFCKCRI